MLSGVNPHDRIFIRRASFSLAITSIVIVLIQYIGYRIQAWEIQQDANTAALVSLSSEQRTLSQRAALLTLAMLTLKSPSLREKARTALESTVTDLETNHLMLVSGKIQSGIDLPPSPEIQLLFMSPPHTIDAKVREFIATAHSLSRVELKEVNAENPSVVKLTDLSSELLPALGTLRDQYQREGREGIERLQSLAQGTFWAMVVAVLLMAGTVYFPLLRKLANELYQRQQNQLDLEEQNKELEQFAAIIAHDLKAPLNNIGGFSQYLKSKLAQSDTETLHVVQRIEQGTLRMGNMISELLQYVRLTAKERTFQRVALSRVMQKIIGDFESVIKSHEAHMHTGVLPQVWGDPVQIEHLFQNLIGNALKYRSTERSPVITIHGHEVEEDMVRIFVDDNGPGLPPGTEEKIFEPFRRLPETSDVEGSGFGLSLCKKIVRRHRGMISAGNRPEGGARFTVMLPTRPIWAE